MSDVRLFERELSWLEFNARVLDEASQETLPLLERARFAAICGSNLDEFYMVRVGALKRAHAARPHEAYGMLLDRVRARAAELASGAARLYLEALTPQLATQRIHWVSGPQIGARESAPLRQVFEREVLPVLTPVRVAADGEMPFVSGLRLHVFFRLEAAGGPADASTQAPQMAPAAAPPQSSAQAGGGPLYALLQLPPSLARIVWISRAQKSCSFALLEDVVLLGAAALFPGHVVRDSIVFRVTRDADLTVDERRDQDFVGAMEEVLASRGRSFPVRLETFGREHRAAGAPAREAGPRAAGLLRVAGAAGPLVPGRAGAARGLGAAAQRGVAVPLPRRRCARATRCGTCCARATSCCTIPTRPSTRSCGCCRRPPTIPTCWRSR